MTKPTEAAEAEMPEIDLSEARYRLLGRGPAARKAAFVRVAVPLDLWEHFGGADEMNAALRSLVEAARHVRTPR